MWWPVQDRSSHRHRQCHTHKKYCFDYCCFRFHMQACHWAPNVPRGMPVDVPWYANTMSTSHHDEAVVASVVIVHAHYCSVNTSCSRCWQCRQMRPCPAAIVVTDVDTSVLSTAAWREFWWHWILYVDRPVEYDYGSDGACPVDVWRIHLHPVHYHRALEEIVRYFSTLALIVVIEKYLYRPCCCRRTSIHPWYVLPLLFPLELKNDVILL